MAEDIIRITQRVAAAPAEAFDAWVRPEAIARWLGAPAQAMTGVPDEIVAVEADARVGGRFSFKLRRQGQLIDHVGSYLHVERPHELAFTWGVAGFDGACTVRVSFAPAGDGTAVTLSVEGVEPAFRERTEQGWGRILGAIAATV